MKSSKGRHASSERYEELIPSTELISKENIEKFNQLKEMFPNVIEDELIMTLNSLDWDTQSAVNELSKMSPKKSSKKGASKKASTEPTTTTTTAAPAKPANEQQPHKQAPKAQHQQQQPRKQAPKAQQQQPHTSPKLTIVKPTAAPTAPAPAPAPAVQPVDAGEMLNISKNLEEQIAEIQRQAALLISIKEELKKATDSGDEAVNGLKKELADLENEEKRISAKLEETRKKLATIDDKIAAAEKDKDKKVSNFISSCKDKGLNVKL